MDTFNFDDNTESFEVWKQENTSSPSRFSEAALILNRLQQSVRLLAGELNHDSRGKVLKSMGIETEALAKILTSKQLMLLSNLSAAISKLVMELSDDAKGLDASTMRTLSHALDVLRGYSANESRHGHMQKLPIHILVLDDDPIYRKIMQRALGTESMSAVLCETAEQAFNCLDAYHFDVVFSDIVMPEVDGFSFIKRLRKIETHANTPVIFVTALNDLVTRSRSRLTGGCDFIAKPIRPAELAVKAITFAWKSRLSRSLEGIEPAPEALPPASPGSGREALAPREKRPRVGVISISQDGRIKSVSQDGANILGYTTEELANADAIQLLAIPGKTGETENLTMDWLTAQAKSGTSALVLARCKSGDNTSAQMRVSKSGISDTALFVCLFTANLESTNAS